MSTRHVILALLDAEQATGYELAQREAISTEPVWSATHSQIYPALHKLEKEGLVEGEESIRGERMRRVVYQITDKGREELEEWKSKPVQYLPFRDPFRLWTAFIESIPPEISYRNIDEHIRLHTGLALRLDAAAEAYLAGAHPLVEVRKGKVPKKRLERIQASRASMYRELAALSRFEVESAMRTRELVHELHPDHDPPPLPDLTPDALEGVS